MRSLQITLLTTTHITAHELVKDEFSSVLLLSIADIRVPFGDENSMPNVGLEADANMWRGRTLPDTVSPTFTTCNISRTYSLQIDIGLSVMSRAGNEHVDVFSPFFELNTGSNIFRSSPSTALSKFTPVLSRLNSSSTRFPISLRRSPQEPSRNLSKPMPICTCPTRRQITRGSDHIQRPQALQQKALLCCRKDHTQATQQRPTTPRTTPTSQQTAFPRRRTRMLLRRVSHPWTDQGGGISRRVHTTRRCLKILRIERVGDWVLLRFGFAI